MCGITGILSPSGRHVIVPMTEAIVHRGPDACGYYRDEHIALGNRRLSIIDLATGDQPISNERGNLQLVCNGEIYNSPELRRQLSSAGHQFKTMTDIEVILHLYEDFGTDCVKHLRGMFAFAIWDKDERTLFLARDHMGQKPLFFFHDGDHFLFASEVKAILASGLVPPEIDLEGVWHYVSMRFLPDRRSLFKGIQKLPAGTSLHWQDGAIRLERYWELRFTDKFRKREREIEEELDALLQDTVRMHLLSDVRVGAFLSGGIDSSLVSAMMAKTSDAPVPVFSIGVKEQGFDELPYARQVAARYGMEAHERVVEADLIRMIPAMVHHMDEPADPFGAGVYLVSGIARQGRPQGGRVRRSDSGRHQVQEQSAQILDEEGRRPLPAAGADRAQEAGVCLPTRAMDAHRPSRVHHQSVRVLTLRRARNLRSELHEPTAGPACLRPSRPQLPPVAADQS
jgi:asparagine synthase (glutamine-hydrolysing)